MTCKDCLYSKNCQFLAGHKPADVNGCTAFEDKSEWVHLPCKVGDNVYCFEPSFNQMRKPELKVLKTKIRDMKIIMTVYGLNFNIDDVGKTVFLTREEAEKELEKRRKSNADRY